MSDLLTVAAAHFARQRGQSLTVDEWNGAVVRFDPLSLAQRQEISALAGDSEARMTALTVIKAAKDGEGKPLFSDDAVTLGRFMSEVDPVIINRIAQAVLRVTPEADLGN